MSKKLHRLWYSIFSPDLSQKQQFLLKKHSIYYRNLNKENQKRFAKRLAGFLKLMDFKTKDLPEVTDEMKVVVGSAFIQISFGFKRFLPKHFHSILLMRGRYHFRNSKEQFLGHVDMKAKIICLSWEDVQIGFQIPDDALNVALHEMAHVWEAEHNLNEDFEDIFIEQQLNNWKKIAQPYFPQILAGQYSFLRKYGGQNQRELLATCVEAFFEQPKEFQQELPNLYEAMVQLLKQNPINITNPLQLSSIQ